MSTRFTISRSIRVLPTRSPMPRIVPCTRGARLERGKTVDRPHVTVAVPVPVDADMAAHSAMISLENATTARAPAGVA